MTNRTYYIIRRIAHSAPVAAPALLNLIDNMTDPEYWLSCLDAFGVDRCRGDILAQSVAELGSLQTLRIIASR